MVMEVFAKQNPIGLDAIIAQVQTALMQLENNWGVEIDGYPRCYPLERDGKKGIEYYITSREYSKSLIVGERNKFFFTLNGNPELIQNGYYNAKIRLYFIVNPEQCKPDITHRADAEIWADVQNKLQSLSGIIQIDDFIVNIEDVFSGYDFAYTDDMQPYHAFRFDFTTLEFKLDQTICLIN